MASASIAQVHRARLHDGQTVAVKIAHEGIEARIHRDLTLMMTLAELAQKHAPALRPYRPVNTVREFRRTLLRKLDLTAERRNLEEFRRNFADDTGVHFPKPHPELCSRRVLTMELLEGVPGRDVAEAASAEEIAAFTRRAGTMYVNMIFRDGFFHADPHPGTYLLLPGGAVGLLDFGMVGRLDDELRGDLEAVLLAVTEGDVGEVVERVIHLGSPPRDLDRQAFRADVTEFVAEYASRPMNELNVAAALGEMLDIISRYHILLPSNASLLLRTLTVLEGPLKELDPTFSVMDLIQGYEGFHAQSWGAARQWLRSARRATRGYDRLLRLLPADLADSLHRLSNGTFELKHEHQHLQASVTSGKQIAQEIAMRALGAGNAEKVSGCAGIKPDWNGE